jgi:nucleoside triphosphatase
LTQYSIKRNFIFFDFACKTNLTSVKLNQEAEEYVWVTLEETLTLDVEPYARHIIEEYIEKCSRKVRKAD